MGWWVGVRLRRKASRSCCCAANLHTHPAAAAAPRLMRSGVWLGLLAEAYTLAGTAIEERRDSPKDMGRTRWVEGGCAAAAAAARRAWASSAAAGACLPGGEGVSTAISNASTSSKKERISAMACASARARAPGRRLPHRPAGAPAPPPELADTFSAPPAGLSATGVSTEAAVRYEDTALGVGTASAGPLLTSSSSVACERASRGGWGAARNGAAPRAPASLTARTAYRPS